MDHSSIPHVAKKTWEVLYTKAHAFYELAPWQWMEDVDVFGVQDPITKEHGYCCVLGNAGQVFGLAYYRGEEGVNYLEALLEDLIGKEETLYQQNVLIATFGPKHYLDKPDHQVVKMLGYIPSNKDCWPVFSSHLPGYYPWPLTEAEAQLFIIVFDRAMAFAKNFREHPEILNRPDLQSFLVDHYHGDGNWKLQWIKPKRILKAKVSPLNIELEKLKELEARIKYQNEVWELGMFYIPEGVAGKERAYFPRGLMAVELETGFVLNVQLLEEQDTLGKALINFLFNTVEKHQTRPLEIHIKRPDIFNLLNPLSTETGLQFQLRDTLPAWEEAQDHFTQRFGKFA